MSAPELVALMLADARLPTGGHTQSNGLEPAVRAGLGADGNHLEDVAAYARDRLRTVTRVEAATAAVTRHLILHPSPPSRAKRLDPAPPSRGERLGSDDQSPRLDGGPPGLAELRRAELRGVERAWAGRTGSQVLRGVSRRQGRLLLRVASRVWPEVAEYLPGDQEVPRPIVLGVVAAVNGLSAEQLVRVVGYEDAQTVVSASLKLLPVDPADATAWLVGLHDDIERLVKDVAPLTDPDAIPAGGAPLIDVFAHHHATERMRLFHA
ncbi:urease accessory protein UreF [Kribbella sp.]|uniref:urease accessory protein UreF n=1 Tax=Kribbella sp. TaxID=1871183 RepID=UPI002D759DF5|nr:urease accessory UreF family protein [Kribbella sp.]HZX05698.1 urease accessory UreF family protein [Kribbella sp.]